MPSQDFLRQLPNEGHNNKPLSLYGLLHLDGILLSILIALTGYGLLVLYSAAGQNFDVIYSQITKFVVAFTAMIVLAQVPPRIYQRWSPVLFVIGVGLLIAVIFFGVGAKGAQRWLALPGFRFQPSEIMKLIMPMAIAWYLADRVLPPKNKYVFVTLLLIAIPTLLIAKQPDMGTSLLVASSGIFVLFLSGISISLIFAFVLSAIAAAPILWMFFMREYQKQRVLTLLNPESDPHGAGWNIIQSKTAIGSGGGNGKGWLEGTQSQLDFLPESTTDFIIAVLAEEFGFVGVFILLVIYLLIVARGITIAMEAPSTYERLLAGSITLTFFVYVFVNIGMVSGILPVVGVPLPLVSVGGTSLVTLFAGFGILMSIHTHKTWLSH